ncbi:phosphatase PAP2 family protein [Streptomyces chumphonensis]|uniref:Phosphatase PAP2 family protein n=1 Tax=Streptomyces chumphonensis TaxID=1214925 RepID=A0A927IBE5_9ACTN|nr:phosphatase PAP2 family protein [Streptomyces chumphonensis]
MGVPTTRHEGDDGVATASPLADNGASSRSRWARGRRSPRRPVIWVELGLIGVSYFVYSMIRNAVPEHETVAMKNAHWVWDLESGLGLAFEESWNHAINSVTWLIVSMNYYYATLHFVVTIGVLVWLYRFQPGRYAAARTALFATTGVALLGYYLYPLAPPRLMTGGDFIDTVIVHDTWGSMASGNMANVSNQYAAMPSMHIGWSAWCGVLIVLLARPLWVKALGVLYPVLTLVVIVATANHFWLDAVGGLLCLAFGFAVAWLWSGRLPHRLPAQAARRGRPDAGGVLPARGPEAGAPVPASAPAASEPAVPAGPDDRRQDVPPAAVPQAPVRAERSGGRPGPEEPAPAPVRPGPGGQAPARSSSS